MKNTTVCLITLGCPKNLVDSENLLARLGERSCVLTDSAEDADVLIVNTCGFLKSAVDESMDVIRKLCEKKKTGQKIIVYGCLVQRFGGKMPKIKGVDALFGVGCPESIVSTVCKTACVKSNCLPRLISTYPYAYLKISEGCENCCSYCLIPSIRGPLKSRTIRDLYDEARRIKDMGIKELILVAQDTANYGKDRGEGTTLEKLLEKLAVLKFHWLRVMYLHPAHLNDRILKTIADVPGICRYLDIPLQHVHPEILEKMNRPVLDYGAIVDKIRDVIPGVRLRTTFITGFPGEKERHFRALADFIKEKEFDRLGVFAYSKEKGTPAFDMPGQVPEKMKKERERILMELQQKISRRKLKSLVGTEIEVLVEGRKGKYFTGRTEYDAPDIDGTVYIKTAGKLKTGDFRKVLITSSGNYDLYARF